MAGIAGLICLDNTCDRIHRDLVARLGGALQHRGKQVYGPIDNGMVTVMLRAPCGAGSGSVVTGSAAGAETLAATAATCSVAHTGGREHLLGVLDGKLYNATVLASELATLGQPCSGANAAELAGSAWRAWGSEAAGRLEGPFAAVLCDAQRRRAVLMRDHFGSRPLVYAMRGRHLLFASEVRALLAAGMPRRLDERALIQWCLFEDVAPPDTLFDGIRTLPPGHALEVGAGIGSVEPMPYFHPTTYVDPGLYEWLESSPDAAVVDQLDGLIRRSVLDALPPSGKVAVMLSGGVDSSMVTAMAARVAAVHAYHLSVAGHPRFDERPAATLVARKLGIGLEVLDIDGARFLDELPEATWANELPLWHSQCVPFRLIAKRAGHDGTTTLLTGDMLDGLFSADRHKSLRWLLPARRVVGRLPAPVRSALTKVVYEREGLSSTAPQFVRGAPLGLQLADSFAHTELRRQCEEAYRFVVDGKTSSILGGRLADLVQWAYRFQHRGDRLCAGSGIEYRTPYQDPRLTSMTMNLPLRLMEHSRESKWALRKVAKRYLPGVDASRPKVAWRFPIEEYLEPLAQRALFDGGFCVDALRLPADALGHVIDDRRGHFSSYYRLLHAEVWGRLYFLRQSVDEVRTLLQSVSASSRHRQPTQAR